jgi:hypothetical protein
VILVNYDHVARIDKQISEAKDFFKRYDFAKKDFLLKRPALKDLTINVNDLIKNVQKLESFDVLGLTEKELGRSILGRCKAIAKIRTSLNEVGMNLPIHVFGCLDPLSMLAYFLCGADIFDGLVWLKYGFHENFALYHNNFGLISKQWPQYDENLSSSMYLSNLSTLTELMIMMRRIPQNWDLARLQRLLSGAQFRELRDLIDSAELTMDVS